MSKKDRLNIRMDDDLKEKFKRYCKRIGSNMSIEVTKFAKRVTSKEDEPRDRSRT